MLVEAIKLMKNEQLDSAIFFGQDLDDTCVKMTALNLLFFNVNGYVIQGECDTVYQTKRSYLGGSIRELKGEDFETFKDWYTCKVKNTPQLQASKPVVIPAEEVEQLKLI